MREVFMIRRTVQKIGKQLEKLTERDVPMTRAFDILSSKARTIEEIVVVEVMREVYQEIVHEAVFPLLRLLAAGTRGHVQ